MKNTKKMKKGFTLLEIIFAIIVSTGIMYLGMTEWKKNDWLDSVNNFNQDLYNIIDKGVMNNVTGYINSTGGDCSTSTHYTDISAARVVDCNEWSSVYPYLGTKNTNGKDSYISKLLKNYTSNGVGCRLYIDDKDSISFYYYLDCSALNYDNGSTRYKKYIEEKILSYSKNKFSTLFQGADRLSTSIDNDTGGTDSDGKIRILIKK
jgi:hypothetical protein